MQWFSLPYLYKEKFPEMTKLFKNLVVPPLFHTSRALWNYLRLKIYMTILKHSFEEAEEESDFFRDDFKIWCLLFLDNGKKLSNIFCLQWMKEILAMKMLQVVSWHQIWDLLQKYDKQYFKNRMFWRETFKKLIIS